MIVKALLVFTGEGESDMWVCGFRLMTNGVH